jgi:hypothetical protein
MKSIRAKPSLSSCQTCQWRQRGQGRAMPACAAFLALVFLAGCASSSEPGPTARSTPAPSPGATAPSEQPADAAATSRRTVSTRPSDWALAIVGTPFVFAFRTVVCAASAVVAGPAAALFAVSDDPRGGFAYLSDGLAQNCGPPYVVSVPAGYGYRDPAAVYAPAPELGQPRPLTRYGGAAVMSP